MTKKFCLWRCVTPRQVCLCVVASPRRVSFNILTCAVAEAGRIENIPINTRNQSLPNVHLKKSERKILVTCLFTAIFAGGHNNAQMNRLVAQNNSRLSSQNNSRVASQNNSRVTSQNNSRNSPARKPTNTGTYIYMYTHMLLKIRKKNK